MEFDTQMKNKLNFPDLKNCKVAVIGLGYVGLPLALEFSKCKKCLRSGDSLCRHVVGFDINETRLQELKNGIDRTNETLCEELREAKSLDLTSNPQKLASADVLIVTVPTPIDSSQIPDLTALKNASKTAGQALKLRAERGAKRVPLIIYESTVYPGATEEVCIPILEKESGLRLNEGFACGYSPERINPGDKLHCLTNISKVTSGSSVEASDWVDAFYGSIIEAGTHLAPSLKVAEAAKVIENTQRDLNIALVNELSIIFNKLGIDTLDVLEAAETKWNFMAFRPGLVGGHCIGVDPYYLTYKAQQHGYNPEVVLAGRRINSNMGYWIIEQLVRQMARRKKLIGGARVLILGMTFKENCPDLRNTRVVDLIDGLKSYGMEPVVYDSWADTEESSRHYGIKLLSEVSFTEKYAAVIAAVPHKEFFEFSSLQWQSLVEKDGILLDLKGIIPRELKPVRL